MVFLASLLSQLLVAVTLVVALGLGAAVAYFYAQARRREAAEAEREAHEIKQRDSELSHIRERIEEIYERQNTGSETQFARVDQQLEELQSHLDAKGRQIDGVQGQMRHELQRHGDEIAELRNQLREAIEVFAAAALPAAQPAAPALEAHVEPTPEARDPEPPAKSPQSIIYAPKAEEQTDAAPAFAPVHNHLKDDHELLDDLFGGTNLDSEEADEIEEEPTPVAEEPAAAEPVAVAEPAEEEAAPATPFASGGSFVTREVVDLTEQAEPRDDLAFVDLAGSAPQDDAWVAEVEPLLDAADAAPDAPHAESDLDGSDLMEDAFATIEAEGDEQAEESAPPPVQWAALGTPTAEAEPEPDDAYEIGAAYDEAEADAEEEAVSLETDAMPADSDTHDAPSWETADATLTEAQDAAQDALAFDIVTADEALTDEVPRDEMLSDDAFADVEIETAAPHAAEMPADEADEPGEDADESEHFEADFALETGSPFDPFGADTHDVPEPLPAHGGDGMSAPNFEADPFADTSPEYHPEPTTDLDSLAEPSADPVADLSDLAFDASELGPVDADDDAPLSVSGEEEDLTILTVVDETMQQRLYALGITTIEAIARWSRSDARRIADQITHTSEEDIMDRWVFEAQSILFERYQDELRGQRQQRLNAN